MRLGDVIAVVAAVDHDPRDGARACRATKVSERPYLSVSKFLNFAELEQRRRLPLALEIELCPARGASGLHHAYFVQNAVPLAPAFLEMLRLVADAQIMSALLPPSGR